MRFIGHTMAVPGMDIVQALELFASLGLEGIELVAQENTPFHLELPDAEIQRIMEGSRACNLPVVTLTPYFWAINSADGAERRANLEGLIRAVHLAKRMGAKFVRSYGGKEEAGGTKEENFDRAVAALKEAGAVADAEGITLLVENHPGTMTRTGVDTRRMIDAVGMDSVRALYDPCNVLNDTGEDWLTTYRSQAETIAYVHCKDYAIVNGSRSACVVGDGVVPWLEIMRKLGNRDLCISFEYEKRWYPDQIEDAVTGLPKCMRYIKEALR